MRRAGKDFRCVVTRSIIRIPVHCNAFHRNADVGRYRVIDRVSDLRGPDPAAARSVHAAKQLGDEFVLWTLESDLVSMAAVRSPAAGVSRIGPVYTPPTGADTATARR